jgi:D-ribose pyranose/furanose isomerase RbsD
MKEKTMSERIAEIDLAVWVSIEAKEAALQKLFDEVAAEQAQGGKSGRNHDETLAEAVAKKLGQVLAPQEEEVAPVEQFMYPSMTKEAKARRQTAYDPDKSDLENFYPNSPFMWGKGTSR